MNPERGRKLPRIPDDIDLLCPFQNMNPERGRKHRSKHLGNWYPEIAQFQNMNPERGRKPSQGICGSYHYPLISEHEPRKGTETILLTISYAIRSSYFRTWTPKGDGNIDRIFFAIARISSYFRTWTPKGDGNNQEPFGYKPNALTEFQNMNPERGRKRWKIVLNTSIGFFISEHEPRKGTETIAVFTSDIGLLT